MKVLWYNVWTFPFMTSNDHINKVVEYILQIVETHNPDVILLGELFDKITRTNCEYQLLKGLPNWTIVREGEIVNWIGQQTGGIFAMYRNIDLSLINARYHILSGGVLQDCLAAKGVLGLRFIDTNGNKIWICGTHLQDPDAGLPGLCTWSTKNQFSEVLKVIGTDNHGWTQGEKYVILGDFNLPPTKTISLWSQKHLILLNPGLSTHTKTGNTLDYGLTNKVDECIDTQLAKPKQNYINPSDHEAICVNIPGIGISHPPHVKNVPKLSTNMSTYFIMTMILFICYYNRFHIDNNNTI